MVLFWKEYFTIKCLTTRAGEVLTLRLWQVQKQAWTSTLPSLGLKGLIKKSRWIYSLWGFAEWVQGLKKRKKGNEPKKHCKKNKKIRWKKWKVQVLCQEFFSAYSTHMPCQWQVQLDSAPQAKCSPKLWALLSFSFIFVSTLLIPEIGLKRGENDSSPSELVQGLNKKQI